MKNALVLHGTSGYSSGNWFPWLKKELAKHGYKVWVPNLPKADKPNLKRYNEYIFKNWKFNKDSIIIGHSSGAVAILGILQDLPPEIVINKAFLVAGFTTDLGWEPLKELFTRPIDWEKIKKRAHQFVLFHSDNDPYVPMWQGKKLRDLLFAKLIILKNQGHFNVSSNPKFIQFPKLLQLIV